MTMGHASSYQQLGRWAFAAALRLSILDEDK
jgi:hypothetical protein